MTKKELEQVYFLRKELIMWQERLNELQADIALSPKVLDGMPYSKTNAVGSPTEQKAIKLAEVRKIVEGKMSEIQLAITDIEKYIASIDDSFIRQIIVYRCCRLMAWDDVAIALGNGYTADSVRQTYHRFTADLPAR